MFVMLLTTTVLQLTPAAAPGDSEAFLPSPGHRAGTAALQLGVGTVGGIAAGLVTYTVAGLTQGAIAALSCSLCTVYGREQNPVYAGLTIGLPTAVGVTAGSALGVITLGEERGLRGDRAWTVAGGALTGLGTFVLANAAMEGQLLDELFERHLSRWGVGIGERLADYTLAALAPTV